jgi:hypothetical protein
MSSWKTLGEKLEKHPGTIRQTALGPPLIRTLAMELHTDVTSMRRFDDMCRDSIAMYRFGPLHSSLRSRPKQRS